MGELMFVGTKDLRSISIDEESSDPDLPSSGPLGDARPPAAASQPVPEPGNLRNALPDVPPPPPQLTTPTAGSSSSAVPAVPTYAAVGLSRSASESPGPESGTPVATAPPPSIPPPPPPPVKLSSACGEARTRAFHWDEVSSDQVAPSLQTSTSFGRKHLNTVCLQQSWKRSD